VFSLFYPGGYSDDRSLGGQGATKEVTGQLIGSRMKSMKRNSKTEKKPHKQRKNKGKMETGTN
jgi:hypothetical protein